MQRLDISQVVAANVYAWAQDVTAPAAGAGRRHEAEQAMAQAQDMPAEHAAAKPAEQPAAGTAAGVAAESAEQLARSGDAAVQPLASAAAQQTVELPGPAAAAGTAEAGLSPPDSAVLPGPAEKTKLAGGGLESQLSAPDITKAAEAHKVVWARVRGFPHWPVPNLPIAAVSVMSRCACMRAC